MRDLNNLEAFSVDLIGRFSEFFGAVASDYFFTFGGQSLAQGVVGEAFMDYLSHFIVIFRVKVESGTAENFGQAGGVGGSNREVVEHGFKRRQGKAFVEARHYVEGSVLVAVGQFTVRDEVGENDV